MEAKEFKPTVISFKQGELPINNEEEAKLAEDLQRFLDLWNDLDYRLRGALTRNGYIQNWAADNRFRITERERNRPLLELDRSALKSWFEKYCNS